MRIDLNADVGEGFDDVPLLKYLTSVNIACGAHAGSPDIMRSMVLHCKQHKMAIGAHPGYEDPDNFGRVNLHLPHEALLSSIQQQVQLLADILKSESLPLDHVKPHGALYNQGCVDSRIADCIVEAVLATKLRPCIMCPDPSELASAARRKGLTVIAEAFADRAYLKNGFIAPRSYAGSCIENPLEAADQALRIARRQGVRYLEIVAHKNGDKEIRREGFDHVGVDSEREIIIEASSICVHGDSNAALKTAMLVAESLKSEGIQIQSYLKSIRYVC